MLKNSIEKYLVYANIQISASKFLKISVVAAIIGALLGYFLFSKIFTQASPLALAFISMLLGAATPYGYLLFISDYRRRALDDSASEALLLIASSLRAGTTLEWAIASTTRHRFGPIRDELEKTSKELMLGNRIEEALMNITKRTPSTLMKNIVTLWIYGMKAGGNMADLLNNLAFEAKAFQLLRQEIEAQTNTVKIMIMAIVLLLAPAMLAMATNYLIITKSFNDMFKENFKGLKGTASGGGGSVGSNALLQAITDPSSGNNIVITDIINFSYLLCIASSITASALIGILSSGDYHAGIKYIPIFLVISISIYYFTLNTAYNALNEIFSGNLNYGPDGRKLLAQGGGR